MKACKGIFVNSTNSAPYARMIVSGVKQIETRSKNMLQALIGERVAIIETGYKKPRIVGYATISSAFFCPASRFNDDDMYNLHRVPATSKYACHNGRGKWCYEMDNPVKLELPVSLPDSAVRHGRSWCDWGDEIEHITLSAR